MAVPGFAVVPGFAGGPWLRRKWLSLASGQVKGIGCGYWRIVGSVEALIARAQAARQRWMKGIGYARKLTAAR